MNLNAAAIYTASTQHIGISTCVKLLSTTVFQMLPVKCGLSLPNERVEASTKQAEGVSRSNLL